MTGVWVQVLQFLVSLSLLIVLHEGGHFAFAKIFKTKVEKFYLFFDFLFPFSNLLPFSLFKKKIGETQYGIGWFPLGGYVKIAGMVDESMDTEHLNKEPEPWEFRSKPAWQRLLIMLGGIIVNVLLAFIIYSCVLFVWGQKKLPMAQLTHGVTVADSLGYKLGFQDGDKIKSINQEPVVYYNDLMAKMIYAKTVEIERNGQPLTLDMPVNFIEQVIDNKSGSLFTLPFPAIVGKVVEGSGADKAGLKITDKIVSVNGVPTPTFIDVKHQISSQKGQTIDLQIQRGENLASTETASPTLMDLKAEVSAEGTLGFMFALPESDADLAKIGGYEFTTQNYSLLQALPAGVSLGMEKMKYYLDQFKLIFNPKTGAYKGLGGFISIGKIYPPTWNWQHFWEVTAFISLILAVMNLLPIPGLDGGYVLFTLVEIFTGRKVSERVLEVTTTVGLVLLFALMIYANGMDIFRLFKK